MKAEENRMENKMNDLQTIKEIFYRIAKDDNITIEEVKQLAKQGYEATFMLNKDLQIIQSNIGKITTL